MTGPLTPEAKADRALASAETLLRCGDTDGACNRACYAMFDAARAALLASGAPVPADIGRTHSGLISAFGMHLVKNGPVPRELGRLLNRAEEIRVVADYNGDSVGPEDAREVIAGAATFLGAIREHFMGREPA